ncbi:MAG TPA: hypothetical protein VNA20_14705 [Frankiaceae bacterium]|nr:hypothetical protein [Frankiaceae bacterium]
MRRIIVASLLALPFLSVPASAGPSYTGDPLAKGVGKDMVPVAHIAYPSGTDIEFATVKGRDYAVAPSQGNNGGLRLINIDKPEKPKVTGFLRCPVSQNDVQVRGTLVLLGIDGGASSGDSDAQCFKQLGAEATTGLMVISIADPAKPRAIGFLPMKHGVHNATWHPGGRYVYISDSELTPEIAVPFGGRIQIVDVGNPRKPRELSTYLLVGDRMSTHDITFNKKGTRAYVAALQETYILDTTSPAEPKEVARIEDPSINISHGADPTPDGKYLLVTDEQAGAAANGVCNVGGVHVFDISINEKVPVKVGFYFLDPVNSVTATTNSGNLTCTAHVLDYSADGKTWTNGNYAAGVRLLSATALLGRPTELAYFTATDANTWSAKTYKNPRYVFANDLKRGFDVYKWVPGKGEVDTRAPGDKIAFRPAAKAPQTGLGTYCFDLVNRR